MHGFFYNMQLAVHLRGASPRATTKTFLPLSPIYLSYTRIHHTDGTTRILPWFLFYLSVTNITRYLFQAFGREWVHTAGKEEEKEKEGKSRNANLPWPGIVPSTSFSGVMHSIHQTTAPYPSFAGLKKACRPIGIQQNDKEPLPHLFLSLNL